MMTWLLWFLAPHQPYIIAGEDGASSSEDSVVDEDSGNHVTMLSKENPLQKGWDI